MTMRVLAPLICAALAATAAAQLRVPASELRPLDAACRKMAKSGLRPQVNAVLGVMAALGSPARSVAALRSACEKDLRRVRAGSADFAGLAAALEKSAAGLAAKLGTLEGDDRALLARQVLRLDGRIEQAHLALGHTLVGGRWRGANTAAVDRHRAIVAALAGARRLAMDPVLDDSPNASMNEALGRAGSFARVRDVRVHASYPREMLARIIADAMRAVAFGNWLLTGQLDVGPIAGIDFVFLDDDAAYLTMVDRLAADGVFDATKQAFYRKGLHFWDPRNEQYVKLSYRPREMSSFIATEVLRDRLGSAPQTWLIDGILDYVSLACLGVRCAEFGEAEPPLANDAPLGERLRFAGLAGCARRMLLMLESGEPSLETAMVDGLGAIRGDDLVACTMLVALLARREQLADAVARCTKAGADTPAARVAQLEEKAGSSTAELFAELRSWLEGDEASVVEFLLDAVNDVDDAQRRALLARVAAVRAKALAGIDGEVTVELDDELSRGALLHARSLDGGTAAVEAAASPVDDPGHARFTAAGGWAAAHSVAVRGTRQPAAAVDEMLAGFFGRLLLQPGLLRIGAGRTGDVTVIDCDSIVVRDHRFATSRWPAEGASGVPLRAASGVESPIDGVALDGCGYPVTLFLHRNRHRGAGVTSFELFEGDPYNDVKVDCWPVAHGPAFAPSLFGLIPKQPLKPATGYTARAVLAAVGESAQPEEIVWEFRTR